MKKQVSRVIVIMGPTASGKSGVAIKLAQKFGGEIISADSRQIFRGLDIGSGKVKKDFQITNQEEDFISEGIYHHLIDVANPMQDFNVSHFKKLSEEKIEDILKSGKVPIICGGTGFWISAITENTELPNVIPNAELRRTLAQKNAEELYEQLQKLDSLRAENIDAKNPARLIRAIEIAMALGSVPKTKNQILKTNYDFLEIGIDVPKEILNEKIKKRLEQRFNAGMIEEVEGLIKNGVSPEWLEKIGLEYRWIARFLQNKIDEKVMKEKLYFDSIHYAKRQMTWFKKNKNILWLKDYAEIEKEVAKFLQI